MDKVKETSQCAKLTDDEIEDDDDDEEDDFDDEEQEPEVTPQCNNNDIQDVQESILNHESIHPLMESLAGIEIPYRCLYMSCGNFYTSKGQMLQHLKNEHGLEMHLVPVASSFITSQSKTSPFIIPFSQFTRPTVAANGEERPIVLGQRPLPADHHSSGHQHQQHHRQAGHVRHRCPYAQCFTCPYCFGCYSTRYRLNLHVKCSHREIQAVNNGHVQQQSPSESEPARTSSSSSSSSSSLINPVKYHSPFGKVKRDNCHSKV